MLRNGTLQSDMLHNGTLQNECHYKTVRYTKIRLQNGDRYKTVTVTKRWPLQNGDRYKTVHVTKRYVLQNGNGYYHPNPNHGHTNTTELHQPMDYRTFALT
jgi:hypothetical protein